MTERPMIVSRGNGERAEIALTFDDGPSAWTAGIVETPEKHGCHATFFLRGSAVEERPEAVAMLADPGHELGNYHLWSHNDSTTLTEPSCEQSSSGPPTPWRRPGAGGQI